jgi:hypothetical protein
MQPTTRFTNGFVGLSAAVALGLATLAPAARAQDATSSGSGIAKSALGFLSTGGYFITGNASHAIGSTKFYTQGAFYVKPRHIGNIALTGGVEIVGASDHFLPFQGGDYFNLLGPAFRVTTSKTYHGFQPYVTGGLFYGQLRSVQLGFDKSAFTPSASLGVDYKLTRNLSVSASYRVSQQINGFNTDGFGLFLRLF